MTKPFGPTTWGMSHFYAVVYKPLFSQFNALFRMIQTISDNKVCFIAVYIPNSVIFDGNRDNRSFANIHQPNMLIAL